MKRELEKVTGSMIEETVRVQERLHLAMQQPVKRRKMHWQYPLIAILFVAFAAAFVLSQIETSNRVVTAEVEPLRDDVFELYLYDSMYTQGKFIKKEEAGLNSVYYLVRNASMITYAHAQGIEITTEDINQRIKEIKELESENELTQAMHKQLLKTLSLTSEEYEDMLRYTVAAFVAEQKLLEKTNVRTSDGNAYGQLEMAAYMYYEEHESAQIEAFKLTHGITEESHSTFEIAVLPEELAFLSSLDVGIGPSGELEFIDTDSAQQFIEDNYNDVLYEAAPNKKYPFEFGPVFYEQYKENVMKIANEEGKWQDKANELLQIFTILERSFKDDYPFLQ